MEISGSHSDCYAYPWSELGGLHKLDVSSFVKCTQRPWALIMPKVASSYYNTRARAHRYIYCLWGSHGKGCFRGVFFFSVPVGPLMWWDGAEHVNG